MKRVEGEGITLINQGDKKIISIEDLMATSNINPELWETLWQEVNMRTTTMGGITQVENYQVKAKFQPKMSKEQMTIADVLKGYNPPEWQRAKWAGESDKLGTIFVPDAHLGKLDLKGTSLLQKIAKIKKAFNNILNREYNNGAQEFLIASLGDTLNSDMNGGKTTKGTPMENNASEKDMWKAAIDLFSELGDRASEKGKTTMRFIPGNHDQLVTTPLNTTMEFIFKNHPSVDVKGDADTRQYHRFGSSLIGLTHGDTVKPKDLPNLMVNEANQSGVKHREWYLGHRHKMIAEDIGGTLVTSLPAVCEKNKWGNDFGVDLTNNIVSGAVHDKKFGREALLFEHVK